VNGFVSGALPWQASPIRMKRAFRLGLELGAATVLAGLSLASCTDETDTPADGGADATMQTPDAPANTQRDALPSLDPDAMPAGSYCALPGSLVGTAQGMAIVPGGDSSLPDLSWLTVPQGYCLHHFAHVNETRQLRVSPSGDLFAASPSMGTAGGENNPGLGAVVVLPDDNHDGVADGTVTFLKSLPNTQGLTFANGYFYFQDGQSLKRVAFKSGDRAPSATIETVTTITSSIAQQFPVHWPKLVDVAQDGTVYFTNGSDQGESCFSPPTTAANPPTGTVFKVAPDGGTSIVARGFRNPIALRCEKNNNVCLVAELARDGSGSQGGREKLVPLRQGDNWGYPCCATTNTPYGDTVYQDSVPPYGGQVVTASDCANVTPESVSFVIGHTPFGIDFETGAWTQPWAGRAFVALHGVVGSFVGSRVVGVMLDSQTGLPLPSSDLDGGESGAPNMMDFVTGWDPGSSAHGRATAVTFGNDGRMYVGDDTAGEIFWVAPITLLRPQ
jgi:glucose/arabinose dehydrogenase